MFVAHNQVRMHDTDAAGVLYFAHLFRFVQEALEDFASARGFPLAALLESANFLLFIRHVEADYLLPLRVGDPLEIELKTSSVKETSFLLDYQLYTFRPSSPDTPSFQGISTPDRIKAGSASTVHVCVDRNTLKKFPLPLALRRVLQENGE